MSQLCIRKFFIGGAPKKVKIFAEVTVCVEKQPIYKVILVGGLVYMNYSIRELKQKEIKVLDTFLYNAIFIPQGVSAPPKDVINQPELQVYIKDFGKNKDDLCLVAQVEDKIVGAVWVRIINDYGHIDNETPSLAISLLKEYRNFGIGTELMKQMLMKLKYQVELS